MCMTTKKMTEGCIPYADSPSPHSRLNPARYNYSHLPFFPSANLFFLAKCTHAHMKRVKVCTSACVQVSNTIFPWVYHPSSNLFYPLFLPHTHTPATAVFVHLILLSSHVITALNPSPQRERGSPTPCFLRPQHLGLETSLLRCPVQGQGHIGGSKKESLYIMCYS